MLDGWFDDANPVQTMWDGLSGLPGGRAVFSKCLGWIAPYTGTIEPHVAEVREGYARVEMEDQRRVRNHLDSIHAMALTNLSEVASGLALLYSLPADLRGILVGFEIDFVHKARGRLSAEADVVLPELEGGDEEIAVPVVTRNESSEVVTRAEAKWRVGPSG
jgi:acyl-coenzyme A thioesterase PaaI-like protein